MIEAFESLTLLDVAVLLVILLTGGCVALVVLWRQAQAEADGQRNRAEENWCWAELERTGADALRTQLRQLERRHRTLQGKYAELTRRLLAKNYCEIEQNVRRKRRA